MPIVTAKIYLDALNAKVDTSIVVENASWPAVGTNKSLSTDMDYARLQLACAKIHRNLLPFVDKLVPTFISARALAMQIECCTSDIKENSNSFVLILYEFGLIKGIPALQEWFDLVDSWE